jgi:hypothetical protein
MVPLSEIERPGVASPYTSEVEACRIFGHYLLRPGPNPMGQGKRGQGQTAFGRNLLRCRCGGHVGRPGKFFTKGDRQGSWAMAIVRSRPAGGYGLATGPAAAAANSLTENCNQINEQIGPGKDPRTKRMLSGIAEAYERLAKRNEQRLRDAKTLNDMPARRRTSP